MYSKNLNTIKSLLHELAVSEENLNAIRSKLASHEIEWEEEESKFQQRRSDIYMSTKQILMALFIQKRIMNNQLGQYRCILGRMEENLMAFALIEKNERSKLLEATSQLQQLVYTEEKRLLSVTNSVYQSKLQLNELNNQIIENKSQLACIINVSNLQHSKMLLESQVAALETHIDFLIRRGKIAAANLVVKR